MRFNQLQSKMTMNRVGKTLFLVFLFGLFLTVEFSRAQFAIGGGYQLRNESPKTGFTIIAEQGFLGRFPLLTLKTRVHFSAFSDQLSIQDLDLRGLAEASESQLSALHDLSSYDYGAAVLLGLNLGLVAPYVGAGLGNETFELKYKFTDAISLPNSLSLNDISDNGFYWNGFIGADVSPIPFLKPFFEYRFSGMLGEELGAKEINYTQNGRITVGLKLQF